MSRVKDILGVTEEELLQLTIDERSSFIMGDTFINKNNGKATPIGKFYTSSVQDLLNTLDTQLPKNNRHVPFKIITEADIGVIISSLKTKDKAMVQVASNFNCLEVPSRKTNIESGHLIESAHLDSTQGPAATFGPLAASLYRAHFYKGGQGMNNQVNMLEDVEPYFSKPINGKLTLSGHETDINDVDHVVKQIKCGIHENSVILYGRDKDGRHFELYNACELVDQVFNASINIRNYGNRTSKSNQLKITRTLLRAAYESTYLSAIYRKREVLYLTLVGGGVFGNPIDMIVEELVRSHKLYSGHPQSSLKKVVLCLYDKGSYVKSCLKKLM